MFVHILRNRFRGCVAKVGTVRGADVPWHNNCTSDNLTVLFNDWCDGPKRMLQILFRDCAGQFSHDDDTSMVPEAGFLVSQQDWVVFKRHFYPNTLPYSLVHIPPSIMLIKEGWPSRQETFMTTVIHASSLDPLVQIRLLLTPLFRLGGLSKIVGFSFLIVTLFLSSVLRPSITVYEHRGIVKVDWSCLPHYFKVNLDSYMPPY